MRSSLLSHRWRLLSCFQHQQRTFSIMASTSSPKRPRVAPAVKAEMGGGGSKLWSEITELARLPTIVSDLGQGYPDFNGDEIARQTASQVLLTQSRLNQYSLVNGTADLRKELAGFYAKRHPEATALNPNTEVLVTSSGTESLYAAIIATVTQGDEVIVFEPSFPWYSPDIRLAGGVVKAVTLKYPDFTIDEKELRAAFSSRTKLVVFNTPHNPTGHVARKWEAELIAKLCVEHDALCLADEVYDQFVFDPAKTGNHIRICDLPGMRERTLVVGSASKMFSLTGWRVGWLYGPEDLIAACRSIHSFASYCAPTPLQDGVRAALAKAAENENAVPKGLQELNTLFAENARRLADALEKSFGVKSSLPEGGYFLVSDVSSTGKTDAEFCSFLARERGVVAVPMTVFYTKEPVPRNLVRFSICKTRPVIDRAVEAILHGPASSKKS